MQKLSDEEVQRALKALPKWQLEGGKLVREWRLENFVSAMKFVNEVASLAEQKGHHPDIDIRYNKVTLALVTHDAGEVTAKDVEMGVAIDQSL